MLTPCPERMKIVFEDSEKVKKHSSGPTFNLNPHKTDNIHVKHAKHRLNTC